jgi:hypothetical protein
MLRRIIAFVVAAAVLVVLGSFAHSYFVQQAWSIAAGDAAGTGPAAISLADRVSWAVHDLGGMIRSYGAVASATLFIAILLAGAVAHFSGRRMLVFGIAGAFAMLVLFTVLKSLLGTVGIFGARGAIGLVAQMAAGWCAGVLFVRLTPTATAAALQIDTPR